MERSLPPLSPAQAKALEQQLLLYRQANAVSLLVGFVLSPLLFGGVAWFMYAMIPPPFDAWIGGAIAGSGVLLILFLVHYARRNTGDYWGALVTARRWTQTSISVLIHDARLVKLYPSCAWGSHVHASIAKQRTLVLTSAKLTRGATYKHDFVVICTPTNEVVGILNGGELHFA